MTSYENERGKRSRDQPQVKYNPTAWQVRGRLSSALTLFPLVAECTACFVRGVGLLLLPPRLPSSGLSDSRSCEHQGALHRSIVQVYSAARVNFSPARTFISGLVEKERTLDLARPCTEACQWCHCIEIQQVLLQGHWKSSL